MRWWGFIHQEPKALRCVNCVETDTEWYNWLVLWSCFNYAPLHLSIKQLVGVLVKYLYTYKRYVYTSYTVIWLVSQLTDVSIDPLRPTRSIRYFTTEQSSWHHDISIEAVQVDCSIISSVSVKCRSIALHWNICPIRKVPLSNPGSCTTWHSVSDALESSVGRSPNLSNGNDTVVSIDRSIKREIDTWECVCVCECECVTLDIPVVTLSVSDRELLSERNEFGGDGLTVAEQV